jgi:uncharacterized RDD family membrane protein YckC
VSSPTPLPSWKQEVNRRLAEHKNRKGLSVVEEDQATKVSGKANSRAAVTAARVAARYAKTPSYSEMQAAEARAALRVAEAATRAALEAQAAAQAALFNLESADAEAGDSEIPYQSLHFRETGESQLREQQDFRASSIETPQSIEIRWEPDLPARSPVPAPVEPARADWSESLTPNAYAAGQIYEAVEPAQPIHANLIEFPRELVATRRMRPRLTEAHPGSSAEMNSQLSIFEVEPGTVSTDPAIPETASAVPQPSWSGPEWSAIQLDAQPLEEPSYQSESARSTPAIHRAPFSLRLMAGMVDASLILGVACGLAFMAASKLSHLPSMKAAEICAIVLVAIIGLSYEALFLIYAQTTPGMRYAQLSFCTFEDQIPSREQLADRLKAMFVSLLPVGLGMVWAIFDDDQLSWHDRLSRTYLRQG